MRVAPAGTNVGRMTHRFLGSYGRRSARAKNCETNPRPDLVGPRRLDDASLFVREGPPEITKRTQGRRCRQITKRTQGQSYLIDPVLLIRSRIASFHLRATATVFEIVGRLFLRRVADLDVVHYRLGACGLGHSRGRALMLHDFGFSVPIRDASLYPDGKSVLADLRFRKLCADCCLDLPILLHAGARRRGSLLSGRRRRFCLTD
jgi:hypothetical protein